jgi:peptidoglycan/xylan/chitin deacetylase (PgdA/CDA1 family)
VAEAPRKGSIVARLKPATSVARATVFVAALLIVLSLAWQGVAQARVISTTIPLGANCFRIPTEEKVVALTFDDSYNQAHLKSVLATLKAAGVPAFFFLSGQIAQYKPEAARLIIAAGYPIGSHAFSHPWLTRLSNAAIRREIDKTEAALVAVGAGDPKPLFRTPYGAFNSRVLSVLGGRGYANIMWTCDGEDWRAGRTASQVTRTILGQLQPGAIILMHPDSGPTPAALPELIRQIKARGYRFVDLREALTPVDLSERTTPYVTIRGADRYDTAVKLSRAAFPAALADGAGLVLAPGETFQEALCGGPLAAAYGGPVLLTPAAGLLSGVKAEIQRLAPANVVCVGLSATVVDQVKAALPAATVTSISGAGGSVYDMSYQMAKALGEKLGDLTAAVAIITRGDSFPDAIGVAPLACAELWPILLTGSGLGLDSSAVKALSELSITQALKVGTYASLPATVAGLANLSGSDRYDTNRKVVQWAVSSAGLTFAHVGFVSGEKFPDALAAGPYLAVDKGILLLTPLYGPLPAATGALVSANSTAVGKLSFIAMVEPVIRQVRILLP